MKNALLILNIILILAVVVLLGLQFSGKDSSSNEAESTAATPTTSNIVFVHADSILANFEYFNQKQLRLLAREQAADAELQSQGKTLEKEVQGIQAKIQQGLLAPNQIAKEEQRIGMKRNQLLQQRELVNQELMEENQVLNEELQKTVKEVLKKLQEEKGYDYILSYGQGTGVLMVNNNFDVSAEVLARLNAAKPVEAETGKVE